MSALERHLQQLTQRRTDQPAEHFERNLTCTRCRTLVAVFEASNVGPHEHLEPEHFVCYPCLTEGGK